MSTEIQHEGVHTAEFIVSEANGQRSRKVVEIGTGQDLAAGAVLGKVTATGIYVQHDPAAADGTENARAILYGKVKTTTTTKEGTALVRSAEVAQDLLAWHADITPAEKESAAEVLEQHGIILR